MDAGSVGLEDADIMKHGTVADQLAVHVEFGMGVGNAEGTYHHLLAMMDKQLAEGIVGRIVFADEVKRIHWGKFCGKVTTFPPDMLHPWG